MAITLPRLRAPGLPAEIDLDIGDEYRLNEARREAKRKNQIDLAAAVAAEGDADIARKAAKLKAEQEIGRQGVMRNYINDREQVGGINLGVVAPEYAPEQEFGPQVQKPDMRPNLAPIERKARIDLAAINPDLSEGFRTGMDMERETVAGRQRSAEDQTRENDKFKNDITQQGWKNSFDTRGQDETRRHNSVSEHLIRMGILQKAKGAAGKPIPASANTAILQNIQNAKKAQKAYAMISGKSVGALSGDKNATGLWKSIGAGAAALGAPGVDGSELLDYFDPTGTATRATIADLGSMVVHDRSGAAVTASETPRLKPFIPTMYDNPKTVKTKLKRFIQEYNSIIEDQGAQYGPDAGYAESPLIKDYSASAPQGIFDTPAEARASGLPAGTLVLVDGELTEVD